MEDTYADPASQPAIDANGFLKRKRSNSPERTSLPAKITKTLPGANIDFLASVSTEALPLVDTDDSLRFIQQNFEQYSGVIERHESLAANLGARLQAPNSIKRFERLFMHPIKILANHGREGNTVTWFDIVKFYEDKPSLFKVNQKDGEKVCQFYTKQCRVEITADEFEFIQSGQPQRMLPSGTVPADEEKELGTIEFMEQKIGQIIKLADQVSGRGKQLMSRLKARRNALAAKREMEVNGAQGASDGPASSTSPTEQRSGSPVSGFTAVNSQRDGGAMTNGSITTTSSFSKPLVSAAVKTELSTIFTANRDRSLSGSGEYPIRSSKSRNRTSEYGYGEAPLVVGTASPAQPATPGLASGGNPRPVPAEKVDNDGPFKAEMLSRMEKMNRFTIVKPPCDRCRRLQIDCQKNLTACLGCTRKHAKCSWKEVTKQELLDNPPPQGTGPVEPIIRRDSMSGSDELHGNRSPVPVLDNELLGEDSDDEEAAANDASSRPGYAAAVLPQADGPGEALPAGHSPHASLAQGLGGNPPTAGVTTATPSVPYSPPRAETAPMMAPRDPSYVSPTRDSVANPYTPATGSSPAVIATPASTGSSDQREQQIKVEQLNANGQHQQHQHQHQQRLPGFPHILGDRMVDNPAILGTATGDRLAREAQEEIERLQPEQTSQQQQQQQQQQNQPPAGMNGVAKV